MDFVFTQEICEDVYGRSGVVLVLVYFWGYFEIDCNEYQMDIADFTYTYAVPLNVSVEK